MNDQLDKMEKMKERLDTVILLFFGAWISLRIINPIEIEGLQTAKYIIRMLVIFSAIFLVVKYLFISQKLTDELVILNKLKAFRFSWTFTIMVAVILYVLSRKTMVAAELSLEIIIWTGYVSYLLSYKLLDKGYIDNLSDNTKKIILAVVVCVSFAIIGLMFGYTTKTVNLSPTGDIAMMSIAIIVSILFWIFAKRLIKKDHKS